MILNAKQLWQATLADLRASVSRAGFETWIRNLSPIEYQGNTLTLLAPSSYARDWLENRYQSVIADTVGRITGGQTVIQFVIDGEPPGGGAISSKRVEARPTAAPVVALPDEKTSVTIELSAPAVLPLRRGRGRPRKLQPVPEPASLSEVLLSSETLRIEAQAQVLAAVEEAPESPTPRGAFTSLPTEGEGWAPSPRYTFKSFIVGPSNQLAHAAALAVSEKPGTAYNPLFVYGRVGLGKTHLLHAIANSARQNGKRALYITSETFTNELVGAIRDRRTEDFRARYRVADLLLVDDVQFIAGKEATQEEFFHTFNALHNAGRQVVLSSDRPPRAMATLEERLRSRFEWGLIADIQPPDIETRMAILQRRSLDQPVPVSPEVIAYIAQRVQSNIRELEGSLNRVVAYAQLTGKTLTVDTAAAAIHDVMSNPVKRFLNTVQIVDAVARFYKVEPRLLRGKGRDRDIVLPRQIAMYLMREETEASLADIGRELGGRDHSTILHGIGKVQNVIEANDQLRKEVLAIRELVYSGARP